MFFESARHALAQRYFKAMRLAGASKRGTPHAGSRVPACLVMSVNESGRCRHSSLYLPIPALGLRPKTVHLPDIISIFSYLFLPPSATGNLPKREASLLDSETGRSFSLPAGGLRESRPPDLPTVTAMRRPFGKYLRLPRTVPLDVALTKAEN